MLSACSTSVSVICVLRLVSDGLPSPPRDDSRALSPQCDANGMKRDSCDFPVILDGRIAASRSPWKAPHERARKMNRILLSYADPLMEMEKASGRSGALPEAEHQAS